MMEGEIITVSFFISNPEQKDYNGRYERNFAVYQVYILFDQCRTD